MTVVIVSPFAGYWRDGKRVVADRAAVLPDRCIKCDDPANGYRRSLKLSYVPMGRQLLFGVWSYLSAKRAQIEVGLCERHRSSRSINIALVSGLLLLASIYVFTQVRATDVTLPLAATAGLIGGVIGLMYALVGARLVRATKITDTHIWFKGAGEPFLASLPAAPAVAAGGALPTLAVPNPVAIDPADAAAEAFQNARNGAIAFLIGCLITAATYAISPGGYIIAWGAVIFGLVRLVGGVREYATVPAERRNMVQLATLVAIVGFGVIAGGWVAASEVQASQFDAALDAAGTSQTQGSKLFIEVANRPGAWTAQDSTDMRRVASLYGQAADALAAVSAPADYAWYRDGLIRNYREAVDLATQLSNLTGRSSQAEFDGLQSRWNTRVSDFRQLQARLQAQVGSAP